MLQATRGHQHPQGNDLLHGLPARSLRPPVAAGRGPAGTPRPSGGVRPDVRRGGGGRLSALTPKPPAPSGPVCIWRPACVASGARWLHGFPSVLLTGLPTLRALLERGVSMERAVVHPSSWP